jgi:hypothetical protein
VWFLALEAKYTIARTKCSDDDDLDSVEELLECWVNGGII